MTVALPSLRAAIAVPTASKNELWRKATATPSLDLRFAGSKSLTDAVSGQNLITFSRSSSGTYSDQNGVLQTAPAGVARFDHNPETGESLGLLVEEARTNVMRRSTEYWNVLARSNNYGTDADGFYNVLTDGSVRLYQYDGGTAPDGLAAAKLKVPAVDAPADGVNAYCRTLFDIYFAGSTVHTLSFWFRNSSDSPLTSFFSFDLLDTGTGTRSFSSINIASTANKTTWPNGWERVWVTFPSTTGNGNLLRFRFTRTASDQVFEIAGLQLEAGSFPTSYIPTPSTFTGRASTATFYAANGVIQTAANGVARSAAFLPDSAGVMRPVGLLLEAAAINLLNGSQTFATSGGTQNNWVDTNITRDGTLRTSPDGTANALRVTASAADATIISSAAIGTSASRTFSIFLKRVTGTGDIQYTLDNGTTWTTQAITSSWVRYSFPATTADQQVGIRITTSGDAIELWGAQLETGSAATSYIPTTTATVTRAADTSTSAAVTRAADVAEITGTNFSSWYNQNEGTLFANSKSLPNNKGFNVAMISENGTFYPRSLMIDRKSDNAGAYTGYWRDYIANNQVFLESSNLQESSRSALGFSYLGLSFVSNGGTPATNTGSYNFTSPPLQYLIIGLGGGTISRLTYWPTRLSDATLQSITR